MLILEIAGGILLAVAILGFLINRAAKDTIY
jgi:hypothetical protein